MSSSPHTRPHQARPLYRFHGGVHPPQNKTQTSGLAIASLPLPQRLVVPLQQSVGQAAKVLVEVGQKVRKGERIAQSDGHVSVSVHAPSSGVVVDISPQVVAHPSGLPDWCVTIELDGLDEWLPRTPWDFSQASPAAVRDYLRDMGVVGLGGAVFPSHLKLSSGQALETLVLNGAECEPYITCDDRLMQEQASAIVAGARIMSRLLQAQEVLVGIEDNKPAAIAAMTQAAAAADFPIAVVAVPTVYPGGGAKQLIKVLTNKEVPTGVRSTDLGVQCFNVATAYTIYRALVHAEPVISRIVTLTGNVERPQNVDALIGTPVAHLMQHAGAKNDTHAYLMGGPMMGFLFPEASVGINKATNCIIAQSPALFPPKPAALPCIRCGACAEACPAELQPQELYWQAKSKNFGKAQELHLFDCIECGCCAYVCPSHIPLVDYYRFAKSEIWAKEREKKARDQARERHEFRQFRQEREKQEKAERLAAKASAKPAAPAQAEAASSPAAQPAADAKQAAIQAAMARAAQQRAEVQAKNTEITTAEQKAQQAEQDALAAKVQAASHGPAATPPAEKDVS